MNLYKYHTNPETLLWYNDKNAIKIAYADCNTFIYEIIDLVKNDDYDALLIKTDLRFTSVPEDQWENIFKKETGTVPLYAFDRMDDDIYPFDMSLDDVLSTIHPDLIVYGSREEIDAYEFYMNEWHTKKDKLIDWLKSGLLK